MAITRFEEGKWYQYCSDEDFEGVTTLPLMRTMLDRRPRPCSRSVAGSPSYASFEGLDGYFAWGDLTPWYEVPYEVGGFHLGQEVMYYGKKSEILLFHHDGAYIRREDGWESDESRPRCPRVGTRCWLVELSDLSSLSSADGVIPAFHAPLYAVNSRLCCVSGNFVAPLPVAPLDSPEDPLTLELQAIASL